MLLANLDIPSVLSLCQDFEIDVGLRDDRIYIRAPGRIPPSLAIFVQDHRLEVIKYLNQMDGCLGCRSFPCTDRSEETTICSEFKSKSKYIQE
jgi:hypothetical protein